MGGKRIGRMRRGEVGYAVPWALKDGKLREDYTVYKENHGTVQLRVTCVGKHKYETFDRTPLHRGENEFKAEYGKARWRVPTTIDISPALAPAPALAPTPSHAFICEYCGSASESVEPCQGCGAIRTGEQLKGWTGI